MLAVASLMRSYLISIVIADEVIQYQSREINVPYGEIRVQERHRRRMIRKKYAVHYTKTQGSHNPYSIRHE